MSANATELRKVLSGRGVILNQMVVGAAAVLAALAWPLVVHSRFYLDVALTVELYVLLGFGMHLIFGVAGLPFLGYAGLYACGAYVTAILNTAAGLNVWLCWVASVAATVLLAFLFGLPILRLRGEYFMVASLGLGEIVRIVIQNLEVTGGPNGLSGIDRPQLFGLTIRPPLGFYYLLLAFIAVSVLVLMRLDRSTLGRSWFALREDDRAAEAVGVPSYRSKLSVFALGAVWAGLAGGVFASRMTAVSPDSFTLWDSIVMLGMVLVGGMGSLPGVALGAAVMMGLPELFRGLAQWRLVLFGTAIVVLLRFRPGGIWPPKQWLLPLHLSRDEQANAVWRVG